MLITILKGICVTYNDLHSWYKLLWKFVCCITEQHTSFAYSTAKKGTHLCFTQLLQEVHTLLCIVIWDQCQILKMYSTV